MKTTIWMAAITAATSLATAAANATAILCETVAHEHMLVDDAYVSACVDAGTGNIGNGINDDFLAKPEGAGYSDIGTGTFTTVDNGGGLGSTGTFSFDANLWNIYSSIAIGFKFGTGNEADEWFIYVLQPNVFSGNWTFVENTKAGGSGLSHVELYSNGRQVVPEPSALALLGLGLLLVEPLRRYRRSRKV